MPYLETSKDILNISLAVSAFGLAFLLGWILIYFLLIIRKMIRLLSGIEERMRRIDDFLVSVKQKLESSASYLSVLALGAKELISYFINKRGPGASSKAKKKVKFEE